MIKIIFTVISFLSVFSNAFAYNSAGLESETAEELLMFYEEEELVIATRNTTSVRKAPAIATVITAKEIRDMGARNITDVLRKVPGIGISIATIPIVRSIEIRGVRTTFSEKILIMIDGHRMNDFLSGSAFHHLYHMSVENIKRVEIVRGPGSALYGANAFLAVINIVTKEAEDINGLQVTAAGGSFDTEHYNLLFGHEWGKLKASGFFDYLDTDGPSSFIEEDAIGNSGDTLEWQEKSETGLNISYGEITLRGRYQKNEKGPYIGTASALNDESVIRFGNLAFLDLAYNKSFEEGPDLTVRLYWDYYKGDNYFELFPEGFPGFPDGMIGDPESKQRRLGGEIAMTYQLHGHLLTTGFTYENNRLYDVRHSTNYDPMTLAPIGPVQDISDTGNFNEDSEGDVWAAYVQDIWDITDKASLTAGVRHDHYSDFGGTTNPRAGLVWEFMKDTSLKLLYGRAFRAPSYTELYQKNNPSNVGNPGLKPEKINTYEAGLEHRFHENYTLRLNYFYNDLKDLIVVGEKPSLTEPAESVNKGRARIHGVETELFFDFGKDNYGYINYSRQSPEDGETGERLPDVPSQRANAGINFVPWKYLNANVNVSWTGKRPRAEGDSRNDRPSSTLVDLTLIAKRFYETLEIRGSVYNLFDEDYRDPAPFPVQVPDDFPANERTFLIEARYAF